jgi:hypothetical protein
MTRQRLKRLGMGGFFGGFVYERVVPRDHFLVELREVIDWDALLPMLVATYEGLAERGRAP